MKKIFVVLIMTLIFNANLFADSFIDEISNSFTDNIYCPRTITISHGHYYGVTKPFNYIFQDENIVVPKGKSLTLYFDEAETFIGDPELPNTCTYYPKNSGDEFVLISKTPLKSNTKALKNNWRYDQYNQNHLSCFYNASHCPFVNY